LIALDTSVVVAAFASWHEAHEGAVALLVHEPRLPAHVLVETYSVLTRLPPPHRAAPAIVERFLGERFPGAPLALPGAAQRSLVSLAARRGFVGGAVYDLLVAATAKKAGARLLTRDRRATAAYEAVGVDFELMG
jgi:predicted nucleic acid-binding protein